MKIVVFGGTFNPIHNGHLRIARAVQKRFLPDKILFVPSPSKHFAHRSYRKELAPYRHRLEMVSLAVKGYRGFEASDIEAKIRSQGGPIYSILTLRRMKKIYPPGTEFYYIIGMDTLKTLNKWHNIQGLMKLCRFIVVPRPGYKRPKSMHRHLYLANVRINISSTLIRKRLNKKLSIKSLVQLAILNYIRRQSLYNASPE